MLKDILRRFATTKPDPMIMPFAQQGDAVDPIDDPNNVKDVTLQRGFTPPYSKLKKDGGKYVGRAEFNGVIKWLSRFVCYQNYGGLYSFEQKIADAGGYPKDAVLFYPAKKVMLISLKDNNTDDFIKDPSVIGKSWSLLVPEAESPYKAGDFKHSMQKNDHASGAGMWMICNGRDIPEKYAQTIALIGNKLPNLIGRTLAMSCAAHSVGTSYGAETKSVPLPYHNHTASLSMNSHSHTDSGHSHGASVNLDPHTHTWSNSHNHYLGHAESRASGSSGSQYPTSNLGYTPLTVTTDTSIGGTTSGPSTAGGRVTVNSGNAQISSVTTTGTVAVNNNGIQNASIDVNQLSYSVENIFIYCI